MDMDTYIYLLELVTPHIKKENTCMRAAISPHERLTATLRFLATGRSYKDLEFTTIISKQLLSEIIPETCEAIYKVLKKDYLKVPSTKEEWELVQRKFEVQWNFPNCIGAIDGKHVQIKCPAESGSIYYNYKGTFSIILFALVDAEYNFLYIDVGANGKSNDGAVFQASTLNIAMERNTLNLPQNAVVVADDAFPLRKDILKPFSKRNLTISESIFNYRLSRARRVSENAFGILVARFRVFDGLLH
ncbi:protein ANTAGONIST OF LIKE HETEROCHROMATIN PROTEIN 1-like [Nilaparvata lugens]|uniref:protein ANTAGONIST OF LIKE HETEROCHROMATIN PROTEIN 1-like n=1 Tax=Nilaparvata lugens TaxID=108931 RepID=UPI00193D9132|nr:protein ANTAGONIST OF LIKE HETEROCHROMATIN PROTEIN 1-like [Nilaparvata lugens]